MLLSKVEETLLVGDTPIRFNCDDGSDPRLRDRILDDNSRRHILAATHISNSLGVGVPHDMSGSIGPRLAACSGTDSPQSRYCIVGKA